MLRFAISISLLLSSALAFAASSWDGSLELEQRYFFDSDAQLSDNVARGQASAKLEAEFYWDWNKGDDTLLFEPFFRLDERDDERTHADVRQFIWSHLAKNWELSAGVGHVFWGVTESQHLVDIINQTDLVENIDGEDKLGQPMVRYQYFHDLGNLDFYVLPYFRPRTFPGRDSRLNAGLVVDPDREIYESSSEQSHVDLAFRYSNTFGDWSVGFSVFDGTSREADLRRFFNPETMTTVPYYAQIRQFGADVQLTTGAWLLKLEAIHRDFREAETDDFAGATIGAEYTFTGVFGSIYDLGVLVEYSWDERDKAATTPFQNDLFIGARLALNDLNSSEVLFGLVRDLDESSSNSVFLEASTRIGSAITANIELRYFESDDPQDFLFGLRDDSFIQIGLEYYFD